MHKPQWEICQKCIYINSLIGPCCLLTSSTLIILKPSSKDQEGNKGKMASSTQNRPLGPNALIYLIHNSQAAIPTNPIQWKTEQVTPGHPHFTYIAACIAHATWALQKIAEKDAMTEIAMSISDNSKAMTEQRFSHDSAARKWIDDVFLPSIITEFPIIYISDEINKPGYMEHQTGVNSIAAFMQGF